jgi:hypothetical protein
LRLKACLVALATALSPALADEPITINATPLPVFDRSVPDNRFGPLTYLGGLALSSRHRDFEALSGLTMQDNRLIMVTDEGDWVTATLQSETNGTPTGLTDARIGPLRNTDGTPMQSKRLADAEAITLVGDAFWVTAERNQPSAPMTPAMARRADLLACPLATPRRCAAAVMRAWRRSCMCPPVRWPVKR